MTEQTLSQIVDEIINELPLQDRISIAHMKKEDVEVLQGVFELYIRSKVGHEFDDEEYKVVINKLWDQLRETHLLRVLK